MWTILITGIGRGCGGRVPLHRLVYDSGNCFRGKITRDVSSDVGPEGLFVEPMR